MTNQGVHDGAKANVDPRIRTQNAEQFAKAMAIATRKAEKEITELERGCAEEMRVLDGEHAKANQALKEFVAEHGTQDMERMKPLTDAVQLAEQKRQHSRRATNKRISKIRGDLERQRLAHIQRKEGHSSTARRASISETITGIFTKPEQGIFADTTKRRFSLSRAKDDAADEQKRRQIVAATGGRRRSSVAGADLSAFSSNVLAARQGRSLDAVAEEKVDAHMVYYERCRYGWETNPGNSLPSSESMSAQGAPPRRTCCA